MLLLQYFGREYRLNCGNGVLEKIFLPFPEIPVKLVFWEKDEEFPAQVRFLSAKMRRIMFIMRLFHL